MTNDNVTFLSRSNSGADRYAVILAGGDGSRLQSLTRLVTGDARPKQFSPILDGETLLDRTRRRVAMSIASENTFFSLTKKHERYYDDQLKGVAASNLVVQPQNRGTAPAIIYSLERIASVDPNATVAFFPSDHHFGDDDEFMQHVDSAFAAVERNSDSIVLLGIEPDAAETSYGWIEPAPSLFGGLDRGVSRVARFWEKPTAGVAKHLFDGGCLWNSFVMVGKASAFLTMFEARLPQMHRMFTAVAKLFGTRREDAAVRAIYDWLVDTNFSSEVLEQSSDRLLVMRVSDVGWSDLGEPQRVIGALESLGLQPQWMSAMAA